MLCLATTPVVISGVALGVALGVAPITRAHRVAELLTERELPRVHASDCTATAELRVSAWTLAALARSGGGASPRLPGQQQQQHHTT